MTDDTKSDPTSVKETSTLSVKIQQLSTEIYDYLSSTLNDKNLKLSKPVYHLLKTLHLFSTPFTLDIAFRNRSHVSNMLEQESDNPDDKKTLDKLQIDLDSVIELLEEEQAIFEKEKDLSQKEYIDSVIREQFQSLVINSPRLKPTDQLSYVNLQAPITEPQPSSSRMIPPNDLAYKSDETLVKNLYEDQRLLNHISRFPPERKALFLANASGDNNAHEINTKSVLFDFPHPSLKSKTQSSTPNFFPSENLSNLPPTLTQPSAFFMPSSLLQNSQPPLVGNRPTSSIKWPVGLHQALNTICDYNGHADMLPVFCSSIRNVRDAFGSESEPWILNALVSKLTGPAASAFAARLNTYTSIEPLLKDLKTQFWGREGADAIKRKLQLITQEPNECAASFGLRVQCLHNSLINTIDQDPNILDSHREILKQMAVKDACEQFLCGLRPELEAATRAQRPYLLNDAILAASAHESNGGLRDPPTKNTDTNINYVSINSDLKPNAFCNHCNKSDHDILNCRSFIRKVLHDS